ncbi:hypothetical protein QQF64_008150 [Cirrhinus molitorella]|uniref:Secreted protein n=1 Tax=Cirrhinus molitorella TaxID=172907 RepID=A0ABR3M5C7_9TELE
MLSVSFSLSLLCISGHFERVGLQSYENMTETANEQSLNHLRAASPRFSSSDEALLGFYHSFFFLTADVGSVSPVMDSKHYHTHTRHKANSLCFMIHTRIKHEPLHSCKEQG